MKKYFPLILCGLCLLTGCGGGASAPQLMITTASLPNGMLGAPYSQTIQASGGVAPFTWMVSVGALPHNVGLISSVTNTVTISGTPDTAAQGVAFTIKVTDSANQSGSQSYTVSILLEPDTLTLMPSSLSFAPQLIGALSGVQAETVTNTGTSAVVISSMALTGTNAADFNQSSTCGSSLTAGANCTINVTFTPRQLGPRSASIAITDDTAGSPHSVSLSGVGLISGPNASLSATSLTFGNQVVDTTSPAQSITLSNYGMTTLSIASIAASANFGETNTCSSTLASGADCTISVIFTPGASGSLNGTVSVTENALGSPQIVSLSGAGVEPGIEPAPTNLTSFASRRGFDDIVRLSWTNNSSDDDSYHIERCAGATCTNFSEIAQTGANATTYTDSFQFAQGQTFRYRVRAHGPGGYSGYSNIRTQTLP